MSEVSPDMRKEVSCDDVLRQALDKLDISEGELGFDDETRKAAGKEYDLLRDRLEKEFGIIPLSNADAYGRGADKPMEGLTEDEAQQRYVTVERWNELRAAHREANK